ncbi:MAG TPA: type II secretion system F family protein [archaeon]|nr:type II secretion system F family protein [archaeon]
MVSFKGLATLLFSGLVDKYGAIFNIVKETLPKADMKIALRTYMSVAFLYTMIAYIFSVIGVGVAVFILQVPLLLTIAYVLFIPLTVAMMTFLFIVFYPMQKGGSRKKSIESNLPFVLTHMGAIAESGVPPYVIFRLISEFSEYGELAKEMGKIVRNIEQFGIDPLTAVKEVANKTPSDSFREVLLGFVTTTESGGNVKVFLKSAGQQALFEWRIRRERFLQQLSAYAEFYTGLLIAAPLFIIALFSVLNQIQPTISGHNILDLMKVSIYLIVPILNGAFLLFLRGIEVEI